VHPFLLMLLDCGDSQNPITPNRRSSESLDS
jgi:hypothetical protein